MTTIRTRVHDRAASPSAAGSHPSWLAVRVALVLVTAGLAGCQESTAPEDTEPAAPAASAAAPENQTAPTPAAEEPRFTIDFPRDWQVSRNRMGMALIAAAPPDDPEDLFTENVNINEIANPRGLDVQAFYEQQFQIDVAQTRLKNFQLVSEEDATVGGRPAKRTVYRHTAGQFKLTALVYTIATDTHGYVITCSVEDDWFNVYRKTFEDAIATFRAR